MLSSLRALLLHVTVIHLLFLNFSITTSRNFSKLSQQCTNESYLSGITKGSKSYSSAILAVLSKNAADRTDLRYTIGIISTHLSWLGKLTIHRMGSFPLLRKILAGGMLPDFGGNASPHDSHLCPMQFQM